MYEMKINCRMKKNNRSDLKCTHQSKIVIDNFKNDLNTNKSMSDSSHGQV